jgi:argininosuccinate lyase
MNKKLWSGRFDKATSPEVERFTASITFDTRLCKHDVRGSLAHVEMLAKVGLISHAELKRIRSGLKEIRDEIRSGKFKPGARYEDIHMAVEARLKQIIGAAADKLHTGRSRNDQVALDMRLFLREEIENIRTRIEQLQRNMVKVAWTNRKLVIPGFTHLQHGQPVLLAHHLLAYVEMLSRDSSRLEDCLKRVDIMPLGAGALAGSGLPLDRKYVAKLLGFTRVAVNSIDAVSDRDFAMEFLSSAAIIGVHLSRMAEELVVWHSREFSFVEIDLSYCTGSSFMPQKANPDVAELVRAKSGRLFGSLVTLLTVMKALPLAYNRDMQEDKEALFDAVDTLESCLTIMAGLWRKIRFQPASVREAMGGDFSQATDLAEYLVAKGCPFREAHRVTGKLVANCLRKKKKFEDLKIEELRSFSPLFDRGAMGILSHARGVERKKTSGSTAPTEVMRSLKAWKKKLGAGNA